MVYKIVKKAAAVKSMLVEKEFNKFLMEVTLKDPLVTLVNTIPTGYMSMQDFVTECELRLGIELSARTLNFMIGIFSISTQYKCKSLKMDHVYDVIGLMLGKNLTILREGSFDKVSYSLLLNRENCCRYLEVCLFTLIESVLTCSEVCAEVVNKEGATVVKIPIATKEEEIVFSYTRSTPATYLKLITDINAQLEEPYLQRIQYFIRENQSYKEKFQTPTVRQSNLDDSKEELVQGFETTDAGSREFCKLTQEEKEALLDTKKF